MRSQAITELIFRFTELYSSIYGYPKKNSDYTVNLSKERYISANINVIPGTILYAYVLVNIGIWSYLCAILCKGVSSPW
ncbi:MAG: hypothetical protein KKC68_07430, partial [Candidatus Thermoplasmatota archaeon]|nr:hypothetical protein [Candidatus Thermoplasmatota archaeon]MBU1941591.1 hypothetical protein [Candidatus Thermoplasmatota archaeon]